MYIVSKCLLGVNCKYDGGNNYNESAVNFCKGKRCVAVCPECAGGLPTPREPSEITINEDNTVRIISKSGCDFTKEFQKGSEISYREAISASKKFDEIIEGAVLKSKSPSCGVGMIYDGSFSGKLTEGNGVFAELLIGKSIPVITEEEIKEQVNKE